MTRDAWEDGEFAGRWDLAGSLETNPDRHRQVGLLARLLSENCPPGSRLLDLGIGSGLVEACLHQMAPEFFESRSLLGIDASDAMLSLAESRFSSLGLDSRIRLQRADFADLDGLRIGETFDAVICIQALHEVSDPVKQAVFRWTRPRLRAGGVFYIADRFTYRYAPFSPDLRVIWDAMRDSLENPGAVADFDSYHERYSAKQDHVTALQDYENWLRAAGFEVAVLYLQFNRALLAARGP